MALPEQDLWIYGGPILLVTGVIGNALTVFILLRPNLRKQSWSLYLLVLALFDILNLFTNTFDYWMRYWKQLYVSSLSNAGCKAEYFLTYFSVHATAWTLVIVTTERVIYVYWPIRARTIFRRRTASLVLVIFTVVLFIIDGHLLWNFKLLCLTRGNLTVCRCISDFNTYIWSILDLLLSSIIPFIAIAILNCLFIMKLRSLKSSTYTAAQRMRVRSTAFMMISVTMAFVLLNVPVAIVIVTINIQRYVLMVSIPKAMQTAWLVTMYLNQINSVVNFILYAFTNNRFQKELKDILHIKQQNSAEPAASTARGGVIYNVATQSEQMTRDGNGGAGENLDTVNNKVQPGLLSE